MQTEHRTTPLPITRRTALLVIDVQRGFLDDAYWGGNRNNPDAEARIGELLAAWRGAGLPVLHTQHASVNPRSPLHPGHAGYAIQPAATPADGEPVYVKRVNSAFIGTTLEHDLRAAGIDALVVTGLITNHCVSTTARMAGNLGFRTIVVSDATATFDRVGPDGRVWDAETVHAVSLANLHEEFATIATTAEVLAGVGAGLVRMG